MAGYFGFTEDEVKKLCEIYQRSFDETQAWYDGYDLVMFDGTVQKTYAMYSPKSVVEAMLSGVYDNYWNQTESYEALKVYIQMNYDGLKEAIVRMLAGDRVQINTGTFSNDMTTFETKDDVLTLLVHLGYLSYHWPDKTVTIPNKEVSQEYVKAIIELKWDKSAEGAIAQIKEKNYPEALEDYHGNLLLAGINYDKKNRKHTCKIEKLSV